MSEVRGFEVLTSAYLGQDWDQFGSSIDEALVNYTKGRSESDIAASIAGLEALIASTMSEDELDDHWILGLHAGYDPRDDGMSYREWFAHALDVLRRAEGQTSVPHEPDH